jgi:sugar phosphate isomerase/epimerase
VKFAIQENLVPGGSFREKVQNIAAYGYEGVELRGEKLAERVSEIKEGLKDSGVSATSICGGFKFGLLFPDKEDRQQSMKEIKQLLALAPEVGANDGVIVVSIFGKPQLPDLSPWKTARQLEEELFVEELSELAQYAKEQGTNIILEPLNRYESHYINRLDEAVRLCERVDSKNMTILADFFHMNIEEADIAQSIREAAKWVGYVHLTDSNRVVPGRGHTDFRSGLTALKEIGYTGWVSLECKVPGEPADTLKQSLKFLESQRG